MTGLVLQVKYDVTKVVTIEGKIADFNGMFIIEGDKQFAATINKGTIGKAFQEVKSTPFLSERPTIPPKQVSVLKIENKHAFAVLTFMA